MCGIWGYVGIRRPNPDLLAAAALGAARRGPHAFGWTNGLTGRSGAGTLELEDLQGAVGGHLLGHCRLATIGATDLSAVQPIKHPHGHHLAHNGNAYNWADLDPGAVSDSAALASVYARHRKDGLAPDRALQYTVLNARHNAWAIAVLDADGTLTATRYRLPLFTLTVRSDVYLSSVRFHPDAIPLAENTYFVTGAR